MTLQVSSRTLIRINDVLRLVAISRSHLYAMVKCGEFPPPLKLSTRSSAWKLSEVEAWVDGRLALRHQSEGGNGHE